MACPGCGCKVTYEFDSDSDFLGEYGEYEKCSACGFVFDIEFAADDDDEME